MSNKEQILLLLEKIPEYKLGYILAFIQGISIDEDADDAYCEELYQKYLDDDDPEKDTVYTLKDCKKEWGLM